MGKKKVLVIGDEQIVPDSVKGILNEENREVETKSSGRHGLEWAEKLALLTGDIEWIEKNAGTLTPTQKRWLEMPMSSEILKTFEW